MESTADMDCSHSNVKENAKANDILLVKQKASMDFIATRIFY